MTENPEGEAMDRCARPEHAFIEHEGKRYCVAMHVPKGTRYSVELGGQEAVSQEASGKIGPVIVIRWSDGEKPE